MASLMMWDLERYRREKWRSLSSVRLFVTPWTSSRGQITGVGRFFPSPVDLPNLGIEPGLPNCRQILYQLSYSALLTMPKPLTVWIKTNCGKFFKRWEYQSTWPASWEICMQVKKQQLELDMKQQTGSKLGKEFIKAVYCHPAYLTYRQSASCEMPGWMKRKLESRLSGKISITSDMQMTPRLWQKVKN